MYYQDEAFPDVCKAIRGAIIRGKTIPNHAICTFGIAVAEIIADGVSEGLPEEFYSLFRISERYWKHKSLVDTDTERCLAYVRVYQIVDTLKEFERIKRGELNL